MNEDIINTYDIVSKNYSYNSNSLHKLGLEARKLEEAASKQILDVLGLNDYEVIYTSGNSESFTTILQNTNKSIYTENDQIKIIAKDLGLNIINVYDDNAFISVKEEFDKANHIDIDLSKKYKDLNKYDFITITDDIPFFGVLIKRKSINLKPLINGGKSTTNYRSGTSNTPLIASFAKLVKLKYQK